MAFPSDETKDNIHLAWLSFLEALYTFAPWQRLVLVGGIIMLIPTYFIFRVGTKAVFGYTYKKYQVEARPAFTNPLEMVVGPTVVLPVEGRDVIAYAKVTNPNPELYGTMARYTAVFQSRSGQQVYQTSGQFYLGPNKETYIVVPRFSPTEQVAGGKISVADVRWQKKFSIPTISLTTPAPLSFLEKDGTRLEGVLVNNSPYQLGSARVVVFLYDAANKVIGVSERAEFKVEPGQRRAYVIKFPGVLPSDFTRAVPFSDTNAADVANVQSLDDALQLEERR